MRLTKTPINGLLIVESDRVADPRGRFERVFCKASLAAAGETFDVSQANLSTTLGRGTIRGLHFQGFPSLEAKLVRCIGGSVFDVAVDLRTGSGSFLQWHGEVLSEDRARALLIPPGFAHGFQVLGDEARMLYFHSAAWDPASEGGIRHDDPAVSVQWPLPAVNISDRDRSHPWLATDYSGINT